MSMPKNEYVTEYLQYGGQAVLEGVMMRSPHYYSIACRAPNGEIVVTTQPVPGTWFGKHKLLKLPFVRGTFAIISSVALGIQALRFASNVQIDPRYAEGGESDTQAGKAPESPHEGAVAATMVVSLALGLFIFIFLPNLLAELMTGHGDRNGTLKNLITEVIKMIFFLGYISLISLMPAIRRLFHYHGAEHKAINTLEALNPLEVEYCTASTRLHPRCGTSFAIIVLIISLLIMTFVPRYPIAGLSLILNVVVRFFVELLILPIIAGIGYELIRFAGKFRSDKFVMLLFTPGLWSQYLTTREPEKDQIEVALASLKSVIEAEKTYSKSA